MVGYKVNYDEESAVPGQIIFSVGVRRRAREIIPDIDAALARRRADIRKILEAYGVPLHAEAAK